MACGPGHPLQRGPFHLRAGRPAGLDGPPRRCGTRRITSTASPDLCADVVADKKRSSSRRRAASAPFGSGTGSRAGDLLYVGGHCKIRRECARRGRHPLHGGAQTAIETNFLRDAEKRRRVRPASHRHAERPDDGRHIPHEPRERSPCGRHPRIRPYACGNVHLADSNVWRPGFRSYRFRRPVAARRSTPSVTTRTARSKCSRSRPGTASIWKSREAAECGDGARHPLHARAFGSGI